MTTRRGIFNTLVGVIMVIIISVFQLIFLFVVNNEYQGQFVGLIRIIISFLTYLSLTEGGLGLITIFSLYRPLQNGDYEAVNDIVNTTRKNYQKTGRIYALVVFLIAFALGFMKEYVPSVFHGFDVKITFWQIALIIICLSSKELLFFYFSGAYQNLIQADQKGYLNRLVFIFSEIIMYIILIALFVVPGMPIYVPFIGYLICGILKTLFTYIIVKIEYPWLQHKKFTQQKRLIKQSFWVGLSRLPELIISNIDIILVTIFLGLSVTSIYTYYLIIAATIRSIALILISSFRELFGYWIAKSGRIRWSMYTKFEMYAYMVAAFCFILQFIISQYLVATIYGSQYIESGGNFNNEFYDLFFKSPVFILFFSLKNTVQVATEPGKVVVNATIKHKETIWGSYIQALIIILLGCIFGATLSSFGDYDWALYMIMVSIALGWIYRLVSIWIYVWKNLTYNSDLRFIVQNTLILILPIVIAILFNFLYLYKAYSPLDNMAYPKTILAISGYTILFSLLLVLILAMTINFRQFWSIFNLKNYFKGLFGKGKTVHHPHHEELENLTRNDFTNQKNLTQTLDWTTSYKEISNIDELIEQELIKKQSIESKKQDKKPVVAIYKIHGQGKQTNE